jgi:tRNA(Ile)-lysidine synthase
LESLIRLRRLFKIRLSVFHMDHRLRSDSPADAAYVRKLANRHGLAFHLGAPASAPPKGGSIELWARYERVRAAGEVAQSIAATRYADGHTMNDQAETVLMGLIRGWGPEGLSGIRPINGVLVRPLFQITRREVEAFCASLHLRPRHDPSNDDMGLLRNAIRHQVIPTIERATGREVVAAFARSAELTAEAAGALWTQASDIAEEMVILDDEGFVIAVASLLDLPDALASRVVRRGFQLAHAGWDERGIDAVLDLARGRPGRRVQLPAGSTAVREREYVRVDVTRDVARAAADDPEPERERS